MSKVNLIELERLAKAATAEPWRVGDVTLEALGGGTRKFPRIEVEIAPGCWGGLGERDHTWGEAHMKKEDCEFIAAANPATILALIEEIRQLAHDRYRASQEEKL